MKTTRYSSLGTCLGLACCLSACGANDASDDSLDGAPEQAAFAMSLTDSPNTESSATPSDALDAEASPDVDPTPDAADVAGELARARAGVSQLNQALRRFMQPIVALVRNTAPTSEAGGVRVWGPVTRGPTEYRFSLRHGTKRHYGWRLDARAADSDSAFLRVAAGGITVGRAARRGVGSLGIDLDSLASVDPTVVARGLVLTGFAHGPNGTALTHRLRDFSSDPENTQPFDALFQGVHLDRGVNRARLAYHGSLPESATDAEEFVLARVRHVRGEGGRADALVTGGDVPDGQVWVASECWDAEKRSVFRVVRDCPGDGLGGERCLIVASVGEPAACAFAVSSAELPPADPLADFSDPDNDVSAPDAMPSDEPPTDG